VAFHLRRFRARGLRQRRPTAEGRARRGSAPGQGVVDISGHSAMHWAPGGRVNPFAEVAALPGLRAHLEPSGCTAKRALHLPIIAGQRDGRKVSTKSDRPLGENPSCLPQSASAVPTPRRPNYGQRVCPAGLRHVPLEPVGAARRGASRSLAPGPDALEVLVGEGVYQTLTSDHVGRICDVPELFGSREARVPMVFRRGAFRVAARGVSGRVLAKR
jgi:hypothetical protein